MRFVEAEGDAGADASLLCGEPVGGVGWFGFGGGGVSFGWGEEAGGRWRERSEVCEEVDGTCALEPDFHFV